MEMTLESMGMTLESMGMTLEPMGMTLAVARNIGDKEPVARQDPQWRDRGTNLPTKLSTQNLSCLQEMLL